MVPSQENRPDVKKNFKEFLNFSEEAVDSWIRILKLHVAYTTEKIKEIFKIL